MNDWRKPCEHGRYESHIEWWGSLRGDECPGGSPVTAADLEGEKVWWCKQRKPDCQQIQATHYSHWLQRAGHGVCGWRLLIPIPDPVATE